MSEKSSSVSSLEFILSVGSDDTAVPYDIDPLFQYEEAIKKSEKKPSEKEEEGVLDKAQDKVTLDKTQGQPTLDKAQDQVAKEQVTQDQSDHPVRIVPLRVFLNCVDTYSPKYIAAFLSKQVVGSLREKEEEDIEEMEMELEEEEGFEYKKKEEPPKQNYVVIGSLLDPEGEYDKEAVYQIIDTNNRGKLLKKLKTCKFIIYDISRYPQQIEEARWVLDQIIDELVNMKKETPIAFSKLSGIPTFILISTYMTWAKTKPVKRGEPKTPFHEEDYNKRKCHHDFSEHAILERQVDDAGKMFPDKFKTLVLCSGLQYGYEEDSLNFLFKMAWENIPEMPLYTNGKNFIPLIHVQDLATMVFNLLEEFPETPKPGYFLAVEREPSNLKQITKAISKGLTTGEVKKLSPDDLTVDGLLYDFITANVRMEPTYFVENGTMKWTSELPLPKNMENIIKEYRDSRHLNPLRILVTGPPTSGKTTLAMKLCEYYGLHYLNPQEVTNRVVQKLEEKIEKLKEKEMAALAKAMEEEEEESDLEEEGEGEFAEEEEEEPEEEAQSLEELQEVLLELQGNMAENEGRLDQAHLLDCLKQVLHSPPILNQGFVLDDFPNSVEDMKKIFKGGVKRSNKPEQEMYGEDEEDEYPLEEEEEAEDPDAVPYPEFIIGLDAQDEFLKERAKNVTAEELLEDPSGSRSRCLPMDIEEDTIETRLAEYRALNTEDSGVLDFLDERQIHPFMIDVDEDDGDFLTKPLEDVKALIGPPHNFGLSPLEIQLMQAEAAKKQAKNASREADRKAKVMKQAKEEREKKLAMWAEMEEVRKKSEEETFKTDCIAFRKYLQEFIYPTLIPGLTDVAKNRPVDPVDYLAEYLLKENPEASIFDPEKPRATRKAFEQMRKSRDNMFSINALDKSQTKFNMP